MAEATTHQPKSPAAKAIALGLMLDLENNPLGTGRGENFNVPSNYAIPPARIYVINHSRKQPWKKALFYVSSRRGAEEALIYDKELAKVYNVDTLYRTVDGGRDMSRYKTDINVCVFKFQVGSPMGGQKPIVYGIPPARNAESIPPRVEVVEGAWDLYLGNYKRMRATDPKTGAPDTTVINEEKARLAVQWRKRHNPVFRYTDDGETTDLPNPYGFLEFVRETQRPMIEQMDKEYLSALDIVE